MFSLYYFVSLRHLGGEKKTLEKMYLMDVTYTIHLMYTDSYNKKTSSYLWEPKSLFQYLNYNLGG